MRPSRSFTTASESWNLVSSSVILWSSAVSYTHLFLANNPDYKTARDIVEVRHIKANLVSMNVDKLVQEGYLEPVSYTHLDVYKRQPDDSMTI